MSELLIGMKSICDEFNISVEQFYTFLAMGLPVRKINCRWYAHRENVSGFFRSVTVGAPIQIDASKTKDLAGDGVDSSHRQFS